MNSLYLVLQSTIPYYFQVSTTLSEKDQLKSDLATHQKQMSIDSVDDSSEEISSLRDEIDQLKHSLLEVQHIYVLMIFP